jgi:hypothetical protein
MAAARRLVWARILKGNAEAADNNLKTFPPNIDGFVGKKDVGIYGGDYIKPENFQYAEAAQLTYTLSRPDVYNAIMAIPGYSHDFEDELGVDKSKGMNSYDYMVTYEAITIDSRFFWRGQMKNGGYYWKTFDIFTQGSSNIDQAYRQGDATYPFWSHPIPKFVANQGGTKPKDFSYVASLELGKYSFDPKGTVGHYTGKDGAQQSAEEVIWSLPNGFQGYQLLGAWSQRRVDAFVQIVRDPRLQRYADDEALNKMTGTGTSEAIMDHRLTTGVPVLVATSME